MIQGLLCALGVHRWHRILLQYKYKSLDGLDVTQCLHCGTIKEARPLVIAELSTGGNPKETVILRFNQPEETEEIK